MSKNQLPLERFLELEATQPNKVYLRQPYNGKWITYTWREVGQEARKLAHAIKAMDLPEKSNIALMSKNCAHWIITDLAIWMSGHVSVPLYPTLTTESINQILEHSESKIVFVGKLDDWASQRDGLVDVPRIDFPFWQMKVVRLGRNLLVHKPLLRKFTTHLLMILRLLSTHQEQQACLKVLFIPMHLSLGRLARL